MSSEPATKNPAELVDRVSLRLMQEKKRRVWRSLLLVVVVTGAIVYLSLLQRDAQSRRGAERESRQIAAAFERMRQATGALPERVPPLERRSADTWKAYYFNPAYTRRAERGETTGVVCPRSDLRMYLGPSGRYVVLFRNGAFESQWMPAEEFRQSAARLGFGPVLRAGAGPG